MSQRQKVRNDMKTIEEIKKEMKFGDIYTTDEFIEDVNLGYFNEYDGIGYFHDGEKETEISCWNEQEAGNYPYVCWYNK